MVVLCSNSTAVVFYYIHFKDCCWFYIFQFKNSRIPNLNWPWGKKQTLSFCLGIYSHLHIKQGVKASQSTAAHSTWVWGLYKVWTWRIKLWDRNSSSPIWNALASSSDWQPSADRDSVPVTSTISLLWGTGELQQWPSVKILSARPRCTGGLKGWHRGSWLPAAAAVWPCRIWTGENQMISQWKCPWHENCFHVSRKMKSRKVLLFLC